MATDGDAKLMGGNGAAQDVDDEKGHRSGAPLTVATRNELLRFKKRYLLVFSLVMFADWLQGAYLYPLYKSYGYDLNEIAILFVVGFMASAVFGTVIGSVADNVGRRKMCLAFCVVYALSCWTKLFSDFNMLLFGRVLGGIGTSLLFSVFEAWMVSEHKSKGYPDEDLSDLFAWSTFVNGLVAILAGIIANWLVEWFGLVSPFIFSAGVLILAFVVIAGSWGENFGSQDPRKQSSLQDGALTIWNDKKILSVGVMQVFFESAMYAFVFLWSPTLDNVKGDIVNLPFGMIFSGLMVSIMVGSYVFKAMLRAQWTEETIAFITFLVSLASIIVPYLSRDFATICVAFFIFETCCGVYFPVIGTLRGKYIPEATRATIMNIVRLPENVIVVAILLKINDKNDHTGDGDAIYYLICSSLILVGAWGAFVLLNNRTASGAGSSAGAHSH